MYTAGFPTPKAIWNNKAISFSRVSEPLRQPRESDGPQAMNAVVGIESGD